MATVCYSDQDESNYSTLAQIFPLYSFWLHISMKTESFLCRDISQKLKTKINFVFCANYSHCSTMRLAWEQASERELQSRKLQQLSVALFCWNRILSTLLSPRLFVKACQDNVKLMYSILVGQKTGFYPSSDSLYLWQKVGLMPSACCCSYYAHDLETEYAEKAVLAPV